MRYIIEKEKKEEVKANTEKNEINVIDQFFQNMGSTVKQFLLISSIWLKQEFFLCFPSWN